MNGTETQPLPGQRGLFDRPEPSAPYQRHSATSRAAAEAIKPRMSEQQSRILAYLAGSGGATDDGIAAGTGLSPNSVRPRRGELVAAGLVRDSGRVERTASGRAATVWAVVAVVAVVVPAVPE